MLDNISSLKLNYTQLNIFFAAYISSDEISESSAYEELLIIVDCPATDCQPTVNFVATASSPYANRFRRQEVNFEIKQKKT